MLLLFLLANYVNVAAFALMQNVALRKGEQLTLKCTVHSTSKLPGWHRFHVGTNTEIQLFKSSTDISVDSSVNATVKKENNTSILTILSVQLSKAGFYGCRSVIGSRTSVERAQVIVLDGNIRLVRQNSSLVSCEVEYNGSWTPELQLTAIVPGGPEAMHTANQTLVVNQSNGNRKVITYMEMLSFDSNLTNYFCQLYFANQSPFYNYMSTNVPTYVDNVTCTSSDCMKSGLDVKQVTTITTKTHSRNPYASETDEYAISSFTTIISISLPVLVFVSIVVALIVVAFRTRKRRRQASAIQVNVGDNSSVEFRRRTFNDSDRDETPVIARPAYEEMQLGEDLGRDQRDTTYTVLLGRPGLSPDEETARTQLTKRHVPAEIHTEGAQAEDVGSELYENELPASSSDIDGTDGDAAADDKGISRKRRPAYTNVIPGERDTSNVAVSYENVTLQ